MRKILAISVLVLCLVGVASAQVRQFSNSHSIVVSSPFRVAIVVNVPDQDHSLVLARGSQIFTIVRLYGIDSEEYVQSLAAVLEQLFILIGVPTN